MLFYWPTPSASKCRFRFFLPWFSIKSVAETGRDYFPSFCWRVINHVESSKFFSKWFPGVGAEFRYIIGCPVHSSNVWCPPLRFYRIITLGATRPWSAIENWKFVIIKRALDHPKVIICCQWVSSCGGVNGVCISVKFLLPKGVGFPHVVEMSSLFVASILVSYGLHTSSIYTYRLFFLFPHWDIYLFPYISWIFPGTRVGRKLAGLIPTSPSARRSHHNV